MMSDLPMVSPIVSRTIQGPQDLLARIIHDWRPAWDLASEIQELFKSGVRFSSKSDREKSWETFVALRNRLGEKSSSERSSLHEVSANWESEILHIVKASRYSKLADIIFAFDRTSVDEIKQYGINLNKAGAMLKQNKHQMLKEHKENCHIQIIEARKTLDEFWGQYKSELENRKKEHKEKMSDVLSRVESNIRTK